MNRPDLSHYDNPHVPNLIERQYNQGLALGEELEEAYGDLQKLMEEAYEQSSRAPERVEADKCRSEEEVEALNKINHINKWLSIDEIEVFDLDPVGTVKRFAKLSEGWSLRRQSTSAAAWRSEDERDGVEGIRTTSATNGFSWRIDFEPNKAGHRHILDMIAAAKGAADQLSDEEGQQMMRSLLSSFEEQSRDARQALAVLEEAAQERFRHYDHERQASAEQYGERLQGHLSQEEEE